MKPNYRDIIKKAGVPRWFDENGVPRYVDFHPSLCVMAGAQESFLVEVRCQGCGTAFPVALTWKRDCSAYGHILRPQDKLTQTGGNNLHYGAPPNVGCCDADPTMSSDFHCIVEAWIRSAGPGSPWVQLDREAIEAIGAKSEVGTWE